MEQLKAFIDSKRTLGVSFGTQKNAPTEEWIKRAEERLNNPLPPSYKWFLMNYGRGEINGEEIYSIYCKDFETVFGGDIVFQHLAHQRSKTLNRDEIPLCQNDFGEIFYFKTSESRQDSEYPIYRRRGSRREIYAGDFAEFLEKRIEENCP